MANSGTITKKFHNDKYSLILTWTESNVNTANNTSDVKVVVTLKSNSSSYSINSSASKNISLTINGTTYTGTCTVGISGGGSKTLMTKTLTGIKHNSDGSKSISISCTLGIAVTLSGTYYSSVTASGTAALTKIARKSSLSVADGTLGTAQTLTVTRQDSNFTHTITYTCGSTSGTICTKSGDTDISWIPPLSLANQNTSGTSVTIKFVIETFTGSTSLGTNTYTKTFSIPSGVKPAVSLTVEDAMGYLAIYGAYIQNRSKFRVDATGNGSYGSTISSYKITANGKNYTGASVTTDVISSSGTLTISVTVTDSRGRTATASTEVTVLAYANPKISSFSVKRCNSDGTSNSSGAYLCVAFNASVTSLNSKNTATYKVQYKKKSESSYTTATLSSYANVYSVSGGTYIFSADAAASYDVILYVIDAFTEVKKAGEGSTTSKLFTSCARTLSWAFGKVVELENTLEVALNAIFYKIVTFKETVTFEKAATFNAQNIEKQGSYAHYTVGTGGTAGYLRIATITIGGNYQNAPIEFKILQRGTQANTYSIQFTNADSSDPTLAYFYHYGSRAAYLVKTATSTWDLYVQKTEGYDAVTVTKLEKRYDIATTITWRSDQVSSLPTGYTASVNALVDYIVEQGTSGIWTYRKWNSGYVEMYGSYSPTVTCTNQQGYLCFSNEIYVNFPFEVYNSSICLETQDNWYMAKLSSRSNTAFGYKMVRGNTLSTEYSITTHFQVKGRWKD